MPSRKRFCWVGQEKGFSCCFGAEGFKGMFSDLLLQTVHLSSSPWQLFHRRLLPMQESPQDCKLALVLAQGKTCSVN